MSNYSHVRYAFLGAKFRLQHDKSWTARSGPFQARVWFAHGCPAGKLYFNAANTQLPCIVAFHAGRTFRETVGILEDCAAHAAKLATQAVRKRSQPQPLLKKVQRRTKKS
jgi:hypothetical protein